MRSIRWLEVATAPTATATTKATMIRYCLTGTPATRSILKMMDISATPVPRSPCAITTKNNEAPQTMSRGSQNSCHLPIVPSSFLRARKSAKYITMASFNNSAGWKLTEPNWNQRHSPSSHLAKGLWIKAKNQSKADKTSAKIMRGLAYFLTYL